MIVGCWNIRGLNNPSKQKELVKFVASHHIDVLGITESKVRVPNQATIQKYFLPSWKFISNSQPDSVDRIWVGWNPNTVILNVIICNHQLIHVSITNIDMSVQFEASFIYGFNTISERRSLWRDLRLISSSLGDIPWISLGDFNVILDSHESVGGRQCSDQGILEFAQLVNDICIQDLRYTGLYFTWSNSTIRKKLDRAMVNPEWLVKFPSSFTQFMPQGISDHSPMVVNILNSARRKGMPFKFYNCWTSIETFPHTVHSSWSTPMEGNMQFQLFFKLKNLKFELKKLSKEFIGNAKLKADKAREDLYNCQKALDKSPSDYHLKDLEKSLHKDFLESIRIEEEILKQKSRVQWLEAGDKNTAFFHHSINNRRNRNRIVSLIQPNGIPTTTEGEAKEEAIRYFKSMLGSPTTNHYPGASILRNIIQKRISADHFNLMDNIPTYAEIKDTLFNIHSNKAPGPDGFNAFFFKETWNITGDLVCNAVREFFSTGELLKDFNTTLIAMIPKVPNPSRMEEFRPISCCNTIYKCISKLIAKRIQMVLPSIVDNAQSAFIKGRKISDNVLLAQDLLRDYHKVGGCPRVAAKVDIMKAYDSVSWEFLIDLIDILGFPPNMQMWIKACVTTPRYSINFNGESIGYFEGAKGLRQGDPMSPYLFVLIMDSLSQLFHYHIHRCPRFRYHWKCDKLNISHLCFADDLTLLFYGDVQSASIMKHTLSHFHDFTGLQANPTKSCMFFAGVEDDISDSICQIFQFTKGTLPMKYLGVQCLLSPPDSRKLIVMFLLTG